MHLNFQNLKHLILIASLILLTYGFASGQSEYTTKAGQTILLYSDYTWELVKTESENLSNPFEAPSQSQAEIPLHVIKLMRYLRSEEILSLVEYKRGGSSNGAALSKYNTISDDLILLKDLINRQAFRSIEIDNLSLKYFPNRLASQTEYAIPKVTGQHIDLKEDCIEFRSQDQESGDQILQTKKTKILSNTPNRLLNYYKNREYLNITSSIIKKGAEYYITFDFSFNSKDIEKSYGIIDSEGFIRITLINQKSIFLKVSEPAKPRIQPYTGKTIYSTMCKIEDKEDLKLISKKYLDEIGVMWTSGFEAYPAYNINYFIEKFNCLNESE